MIRAFACIAGHGTCTSENERIVSNIKENAFRLILNYFLLWIYAPYYMGLNHHCRNMGLL